ncbi:MULTISPECIES: PASTA domain-containing protein [unclassified Enterococcus]|uniref:PASTA domain-containing protein n=1 Tax=unclassified Enterococcus TaxID=2608891 RepID=UPI001CE07BC6|nr:MULTISPECIES: PASTA domain-containing protein [unclassified Enterococcus]MCA5012692.1 PASTA domain-containing protein [Enterococcus sp. S23]MCA5015943.1 PASTA domain-containing protein [Enterococcus sp. S22(2020)]
MSDFLSNFSGENYEKTRENKNKQKEQKKTKAIKNDEEQSSAKKEPTPAFVGPKNTVDSTSKNIQQTANEKEEPKQVENTDDVIYTKKRTKKKKYEPKKEAEMPVAKAEPVTTSQNPDEFIETDPTYKKKRRTKLILIGMGSLAAVILLYVGYYQLTHVKVPDFEGKELSEVREWTAENGVKLQVEQKYDFDKAANLIIDQTVKNKKIKKGKELVVDASLGADPEEQIQLPEFKEMKISEAKKWITEQKADNLAIIEEYSDKVAQGDFIKFEITNKDVKAEEYKRKDKAKVYFSKGKEVFEKNIAMLDFTGKTKEEVTEWTKKNEITLKVEEADSDKIEAGKVISQSIGKDTKVAKRDTLTVTVSTGKAMIVPDFSQFTAEEAADKGNGLQVQVKQLYNNTVPYGHFISQSVEIGSKFTEKDDKPVIQVVYSIGKPYIKDLRDNTVEGDLQKIFFDEYQSKGANITYQVYYVDSTVTKGTVVKMSNYNEFVPIDSVIQIGISKGNLKPEATKESEE